MLEHVGMVFENIEALREWAGHELKGFMSVKSKMKSVGGKPSDRYQSSSKYCKVPTCKAQISANWGEDLVLP